MFHVKHRLGFSNFVDYVIRYPDQLNTLIFQILDLFDRNLAKHGHRGVVGSTSPFQCVA